MCSLIVKWLQACWCLIVLFWPAVMWIVAGCLCYACGMFNSILNDGYRSACWLLSLVLLMWNWSNCSMLVQTWCRFMADCGLVMQDCIHGCCEVSCMAVRHDNGLQYGLKCSRVCVIVWLLMAVRYWFDLVCIARSLMRNCCWFVMLHGCFIWLACNICNGHMPRSWSAC